MDKYRYKRIFISDVHLGSPASNSECLMKFLSSISFDELYIVGDLIDLWAPAMRYWDPSSIAVLKMIFDIARSGIPVFYITGNHDEKIGKIIGMGNPNIITCSSWSYFQNNRKIHIIHGHNCDFSKTQKAVSWIVKKVSPCFASRYCVNEYIRTNIFENRIKEEAMKHGASVVICGHMHFYNMKKIDGVLYINTGDWVGCNTAVAEDMDGNFMILGNNFVIFSEKPQQGMWPRCYQFVDWSLCDNYIYDSGNCYNDNDNQKKL